jgi:hypothetical protein
MTTALIALVTALTELCVTLTAKLKGSDAPSNVVPMTKPAPAPAPATDEEKKAKQAAALAKAREAAAAKKAAAAAAPAPAEDTGGLFDGGEDLLGGGAEETPAITLEDLRALGMQLVKEKKSAKLKEVLTKYKAENLTTLDAKHYAAVHTALSKLVG